MIEPVDLMRLAIDKAALGIEAGQTPFGCAIARGDEVLAVCHNTVYQTVDATAHAEVNAVREACRKVGDVHLESAIVATTCEPCPMCMSALHWAQVETVYFGATIADAAQAGFNELEVPAAHVLEKGGSQLELKSPLLKDECLALFTQWTSQPDARPY